MVGAWRGRRALGGLQVSTGLPQALAALASSLVVSRSLLLIGSLQLLLLATAAAALAARLLASQREGETAMLSARGAARGQLLLASLAEAVDASQPARGAQEDPEREVPRWRLDHLGRGLGDPQR